MTRIDWEKLVDLKDRIKEAEVNLDKALEEIWNDPIAREQMNTIMFRWNRLFQMKNPQRKT